MNGPVDIRRGRTRNVSGEGESCFYRAIAYQLCEQSGAYYDDRHQVDSLRMRTRTWLEQNAGRIVPANPLLKWKDIGPYSGGAAVAPVPQAMPYVVHRPIVVLIGTRGDSGELEMIYGKELPGEPLVVRLHAQHYKIEYRAAAPLQW